MNNTKSMVETTMTTQPQDKAKADERRRERQERDAVIGKHVMHTLGHPGDLHGVQVRRLWEDHYRVNVFVGLDAASVKVAHSFFLETDNDGNIIACNPKITRHYEAAAESGRDRIIDVEAN